MKGFLESINYSSCNEDANSECRALQIGLSDSVVCVTGSGARTLDLLTQRPRRIVSVDINPRQNDLLHLKLAAIRSLSHEEFLAFLGVLPSSRRLLVYSHLRDSLPVASRRWWDGRVGSIDRGVIYDGRWERHFGRLARFIGIVRGGRRERLFACTEIDEQADVWRSCWADAAWRNFLSMVSASGVWKHVLGDPGFFEYVPSGFNTAAYLAECFDRAAASFLFRDSEFARLLFFGRYDPAGPFPLHLRREHFEALQSGVGRVHVVTSSVDAFLASTNERFSAYSLSDIASYTSPRAYENLWAGVRRTALVGARFCERQFLVKRSLPAWIPERDASMETHLRSSDRSMFYTFAVGRVQTKSRRSSLVRAPS